MTSLNLTICAVRLLIRFIYAPVIRRLILIFAIIASVPVARADSGDFPSAVPNLSEDLAKLLSIDHRILAKMR